MQTRFRLLPAVVTCVCGLVLLSAGAIFWVNLMANRSILNELGGRVVVAGLNGLELAVRDHLDVAGHQAEYIAEAIRSGRRSFGDGESFSAFISGALAGAPQVSGIVVADPDGNALQAVRTAEGGVEIRRFPLQADAQLQRISEEIRQRKEPYWGPPIYREGAKQTFLNLRYPVWKDDQFLGLVGVGISIQALSELALQLSDPPRSTVFVLYGRNKVMAHMYLALQTPGLSSETPLLDRRQVIDPVMGRMDAATSLKVGGFKAPDGVRAEQLQAGGDNFLVFQKSIEGYGDLPLHIGSYSVAGAVDAPLRDMYRAIGIGAAFLVLALIAAVMISRMITRPIRESSESASAVAALAIDQARPLAQSRIKEIDDLSSSFNAMLVGLKSFGRYMPRRLVEKLIRENSVGAGTEERNLTVMFTDIVGFTAISEGLTPQQVADFINHHLSLVVACIEREGGTVDKYIGDAVMAFWGAPDSSEDGPIRAGRAAVAIREAIAADNRERAKDGLPSVRIRIGLHEGPLIVGDIGAPGRINYTVVGDVVNTAQRLEGLGRDIDPDAEAIILVSRRIKDALVRDFAMTKAGRFRMQGRQREIGVYRLMPG